MPNMMHGREILSIPHVARSPRLKGDLSDALRPRAGLYASFLACFLAIAFTAAGEESLYLTKAGAPNASIVIAGKATRAAQLGAYELQWHIREMSGAMLPIVTDEQDISGTHILVGQSRLTEEAGIEATDFGEQEYLVKFMPDTVVLIGRDKPDYGPVVYDVWHHPAAYRSWPSLWDEKGTLCAVYAFLRDTCEVRWLDHTEFGTDVPTQSSVRVTGSTLRRKPFFHYRKASHVDSARYDRYVSLKPRNDEDWRRLEQAAYPRLTDTFRGRDYIEAKRSLITLFQLRMGEGGMRLPNNHSLYGYYGRFWNENSDHFEEKRPEFFARGYEGWPPQLCYANPGLIEQVVEDARDYFNGKGKKVGAVAYGDYFCLEPMDKPTFCQCSRCAQWYDAEATPEFYSSAKHSEYWFHFVNEVAKRIKQSHPDKYLVTLAYWTHASPPETVKLEPNVAVAFCFWTNRDGVHSEAYDHDRSILKEWYEESRTSGRPLYLWLYYTFPESIGMSGGYEVFPPFFAHTIGEQFKLFHRYGIKGITHCGYGQEVEGYITYRLMDDPTVDVDALLDDYFQRKYGNAWEPMKELYSAIENTYSDRANYPQTIDGKELRYGYRPPTVDAGQKMYWGFLGTDERMRQFRALLAEAKDLAGTDIERKRVELFEIGTWEYMEKGAAHYRLREKSEPVREALRNQEKPSLEVPRVADAGGNPQGVDWDGAAPIRHRAGESVGDWPTVDGYPTERTIEGLAAHDGDYLYVSMSESELNTGALEVSEDIEKDDTWELYIAKERGREKPFRRFWVNAAGDTRARAYFEESPEWDSGARVVSSVTDDSWTVKVAFPLETLVPGGMMPGATMFINFVRAESGRTPDGLQGTLAWSPTFRTSRWYVPRQVHFMPWKVWETWALGKLKLKE